MKQLDRVENIYIFSVFFATMPLIISCLLIYFMPAQVPMHYDIVGNIDRWGKSNEMIFIGCMFTFVALGMSLLFRIINMHKNSKVIGYIGSICMSIVFISLQIYFTLKIFAVTGVYLQYISWLSFSITIVGILYMLIGIILPCVPIKSLKIITFKKPINKLALYVLGIGGITICIISALIKNIYSLVPLVICSLLIGLLFLCYCKKFKKEEN